MRWPEAEPIIDEGARRQPEPRGYYLDTLGGLRLRQGDGQAALDGVPRGARGRGVPRRRSRAMVLDHAGEALLRLGDPGGAGALPGAREGRGGEGRAGHAVTGRRLRCW